MSEMHDGKPERDGGEAGGSPKERKGAAASIARNKLRWGEDAASLVTVRGGAVDVSPMLEVLTRMGLSEALLAICKEHHVLLEHVLMGVRSPSTVAARDACAHHLKSLKLSHTEVARVLGFNDHTSSCNAVRRHKKRMEAGHGKVPGGDAS